jgi:hypothetical protein
MIDASFFENTTSTPTSLALVGSMTASIIMAAKLYREKLDIIKIPAGASIQCKLQGSLPV